MYSSLYMELAIPIVALSGLYFINKKKGNSGGAEGFKTNSAVNSLPNTNIPDKNYPDESVINPDIDHTSSLINVNKISLPNGVYTDKYFNQLATENIPVNDGSYYTSLTGEQVDKQYFVHNNMVPYYRGDVKNRHIDLNSNEGLLDNMNGSGSQTKTKVEQSPLFRPQENMQWSHGAPNVSDFMQSRVNPSLRMANVKPFQEEQVGPGLGLGFTSQGEGGFNAGMGMREYWQDKTVDDLRVANKPKNEYMLIGHEGPAGSYIKNMATAEQMGRMEKNRVATDFEMTQDRWFTTTGASKGPTLHAIPIDRDVSRPETSMSYTGIATGQAPATYVPGEYMPSTNIHLGEVPMGVATATGRNFATEGDYDVRAKMAYPNNRSENEGGDYFGIMGGAIGAVIAPLMDALRPSRRENTIGTLRPFQNAKTAVSQSYIFNPADRPAPTIRETTEDSKMHWNVNANQKGGAYKVAGVQASNTNRQTTDDYFYAGNAGAGEGNRMPRTYDAEYNQRNNDMKSATIQGYMVQGNMNLFNGNMNVKTSQSREADMKNTRHLIPTQPYQTPNIGNMGQLQGHSQLYSNISVDRNNSDILSALKSNPYALSIENGF